MSYKLLRAPTSYKDAVTRLIERPDENNAPLLVMYINYERLYSQSDTDNKELLELEANRIAVEQLTRINAEKYREKRKGFLTELGYEFTDLNEQQQMVHDQHLRQYETILQREQQRHRSLTEQRIALETKQTIINDRLSNAYKRMVLLQTNMDEWIAARRPSSDRI